MNKKEQKSIVQMDEQTWRIIDGFGKGTIYSFLLCGTKQAILIDTGMGFTDMKSITDELTSLPVSVVNTHGHLDHIARNYQYETAYLHPADEAVFLQHSAYDYRCFLLEGLLTEAKLPKWLLELPIVREQAKKFCTIPAKENRRPLSDGMLLDLGGRTLEVICSPGHTPGSVCLLDIERRQLFSGDTVCDEGVLLHLDHSNSVETFKESILRLKAASERFGPIWPAHHALPLDHSWLDEYITCADQIIAGTAETVQTSSAIGSGLSTKFGRIGLVYRPDNILA
ncbi:MAG: MBL fold metallo-hydrolase [Methanosarcinaceae archaeon]|nr:MBL fold metallo-hydrolase [Methanosarcinaceae archaeon]